MRIKIPDENTVLVSGNTGVIKVLDSFSDGIRSAWTAIEVDEVERWAVLNWFQRTLNKISPLRQEEFTKELAEFQGEVIARDSFQVPVDLHKVILTKDLENMTAENSWFVGQMGNALMLIPAGDSQPAVEGIATLCDYNFGFTYSSMPSTYGGVSLIQISDHYALSIPSGDFLEVQEPRIYSLSNETRIDAIVEFLEDHLLQGMAFLSLNANKSGAFTDAEWSWMNSPSRNWNLRLAPLDDEDASKLKTNLSSESRVFDILDTFIEKGSPRWLALLVLSVRDESLLGQEDIFESYLSEIQVGIPAVESALLEDGITTGLSDLDSVNRMLEIVENSARYDKEHPITEFLRDASLVLLEIADKNA